MADTNTFADIYAQPDEPVAEPANDNSEFGQNFFADLYNEPEPTNPLAEFGRSAVRSLAPAAASLVATGYGATAGASMGAIGGPWGAALGGITGGLIGGFGGAAAVQATQDFILDALPDDWVESIGQSPEQIARGQKEQPVASFLGGLLPYALAMKPGGFGYQVPANATTFQRILAHPVTGSVFGGAVNGGMELGMEVGGGEQPDWTKIGISTAFGMVFNKPTKIGQSLTSAGDRAAQRMGMRGMTEAPTVAAAQPEPTVAQAADAKVMGPGITEEVFMGTQEQSPQTAQAAQEQVRTETSLIRPQTIAPDVRRTARDIEPELFTAYDSLSATRDDLRARLAALASPTDEVFQPLVDQRTALQTRLDELTASRAGYEGGAAARRMRAELRDLDARIADMSGRRDAFAAGTLADDAEMAALRGQIMQTDIAMRDMAPQVSAALRRAADYAGGEVIEPEVAAPAAAEPVPAETIIGEAPQPEQQPIEQQVAAIAEDVVRGMIAAGRPEAEARAAGALIGRRYATRAARLGRNDPLGLYNAEGAVLRGNRPRPAPVKPPLMPTVEQPAIGRVAEQAPVVAPEVAAAAPEAAPVARQPAPSEIESLDPNSIEVDAKRFQFKAGGDESGVTERLQGVEQWDPRLAGTALVYRDAEGKNWIADGHQRLGLAKRLSETQPGIRINAFVLNAADGITDADARAIAAIKNIAEGTGTATDAAKVLREAKETGIDLPPLPPRSTLVRDGRALANLSPEAFGIIVNDVVPTNQGAIVGRMVQVPEQQIEALRLLAKLKPENVQQAEMIVRDMLSSGTTEGRMESLFGAEDYAGSIVLERAKIADEAMKLLRKDKATFKTLVDEAERIQGTGANVLDQATNQSRLSTDEQVADFLKQLAFRAGPVSDALSEVARKLKSGDIKSTEAARTFLGDVRRAVEAGVVNGDDAGGPVAGAVGERPLDEGPALFQPAYHGTPHIFDKFDSSKIGTGEGAQAFGHGLYFAGRKEVAQHYRDVLAEAEITVRDSTGASYIPMSHPDAAVRDAAGWLSEARGDIDKAIERAQANADRFPTEPDFSRSARYLRQWKNDGFEFKKAGRLLTVEIPGDEELLVWDAPLSEQPEKVKSALAKIEWPEGKGGVNRARMAAEDPTGSFSGADLYNRLALDVGPDRASAMLREAGIPGHKFLDNASRGIPQQIQKAREAVEYWRGVGDADKLAAAERSLAEQLKHEKDLSHNYVIYDDSRIDVTGYEQRRGSVKDARGYIRPDDQGIYRIITLTKDADASTFLHETGHQWLEELLRDAKTEGVSDVVKVDEGTVRKWLGMKPDQASPTRNQHEKFATGFEQYLREGTAPSAALGRVFAQFKSWLMDIYRSIKGLNAPISEDIRAVFDRMIEIEPQRTVIDANIEPEAGGIARTHETDADTIEPQDAEPALDRVIAERERAIAELPPEIANELAAAETKLAAAAGGVEPAGEGGDAGGGVPQVVDTGAAAGPLPGSGAGSGEPGPIVSGGASAGPEGAGMGGGATAASGGPSADAGLRAQRPGAADAARANPIAPSAATLFGPEVSPFTDKAGNIRLDTLSNSDEVRQAIHDAAAENNEFIGDRRGVITDGQVMDLADALGMDAAMLSTRKVGQAFNAEQVMAARKLLIESAGTVASAAKAAALGDDAAVLAYAQARARHQMIQGHVAGITAEAGRALRAFRSIAGSAEAMSVDQLVRQSTAKTLFQLKEEAKLAAMLDTPGKVSKFMLDAEKPDFGRMILEYWINALVSGPRTHVTNTVSNAVFALQKMGPETLAAAGIGAIRAATGRTGERIRAGEVGAQFARTRQAVPMALKAAIDALKAGKGVELPSEQPQAELPLQPGAELAPAPKLDESATYAQILPELFGMIQGISDATVAIGRLVATGGDPSAPLISAKRSPLGAIPDIQVRGTTVLPIGTVARIPTRFLAAGDSFFRALSFSAEKGALAYRRAAEEGLTGAARDARIAQLYQNPDQAMMERASDVATELTFMSRKSAFVTAFSKFASTPIVGVPIVKFASPFINTPANIIEQTALHRTPLGFFSPEIRADLLGKNGNVAQDTAMAKMMVGSAYAIGFGFLTAQGLLNGSGPSDDNEKALWRLAGNQANSVRVGSTWYDIRSLGPLGMLASISSDLYDVAGAAQEEGIAGAAAQIQSAFVQNILNASFMTGPSDLLQALADPDRYGQTYIDKFLSSFVPAALAQPARAMDPYMRQARTTVDMLKSRLPGISQTLMPRIDIWGEPIPSGSAFGPSGLSAIYTTKMSQDPVNLAMLDGGYWPGAVSRTIRNVELTDEQYDYFARIAGRTAKQRLDTIVASGLFRSLDKAAKHDLIQETIRGSREAARGMVLARWPSIVVEATRLKLAPLQE